MSHDICRLMGTPGTRARRSSGGVPPPSAEGAQRAMSLWDIGAETAPLLSRDSTFFQRLVSGSSLISERWVTQTVSLLPLSRDVRKFFAGKIKTLLTFFIKNVETRPRTAAEGWGCLGRILGGTTGSAPQPPAAREVKNEDRNPSN